MDVIGRMPRGRVSHSRASLTGCHWLGGRVVLAKEYIHYIVKPNLALALWGLSIGLGGT